MTRGNDRWNIEESNSRVEFGSRKWIVEVIADNSGQWAGNAMEYDNKQSAEMAAKDLASRWLLVRKWRVRQIGGSK